jgi:hypothetical protein
VKAKPGEEQDLCLPHHPIIVLSTPILLTTSTPGSRAQIGIFIDHGISDYQ